MDPHSLSRACCTSAPSLERLADTDAVMSREAAAEIASDSRWRFACTVHRNPDPDETPAHLSPSGADEPNHGHKQRRNHEHPKWDGISRP
jgi:hypothetical protein